MNRLQCSTCNRWLPADSKTVEYYKTAAHPVWCGQCVNEAEQFMRENFKGHTFITRTPEMVVIDKY